jgi:SAM-dependent methyltransferase
LMALVCPLCRSAVGPDVICPSCGSLEGLIETPSAAGHRGQTDVEGDGVAAQGGPVETLSTSDTEWISRCRNAATPPNGRLYGFDWSAGEVAPFVPAPPDVIAASMRLCGVGPSTTLVDLGSGDGRIVIAAAKLGADATGIELNATLCAAARDAAVDAGIQVVWVSNDAASDVTPRDVEVTEDSRADSDSTAGTFAVDGGAGGPLRVTRQHGDAGGVSSGRCTFVQADLTTTDFSACDVVTAFLLPPTL